MNDLLININDGYSYRTGVRISSPSLSLDYVDVSQHPHKAVMFAPRGLDTSAPTRVYFYFYAPDGTTGENNKIRLETPPSAAVKNTYIFPCRIAGFRQVSDLPADFNDAFAVILLS